MSAVRFDILTLFPEMVNAVLSESIVGRARTAGILDIRCHNIRDYSKDRLRRVQRRRGGRYVSELKQAGSS